MIMQSVGKILFMFVVLWALTACSAIKTFPSMARAGDTTAIAAGWKQTFSRNSITVTITPSIGAPIILLPGDPKIRAVVNLYPDPVSNIIVSGETGYDVSQYASTYSTQLSQNFTGGDKDWFQTTLFIDLPQGLPVGTTNIDISSVQGENYSTQIEIIDAGGNPEEFMAELNGPLSSVQLESLERAEYYVVKFSGAVVPHAIQIEFSHAADATNGGQGKAYVVNPRGNVKSILWNDDGYNLKALLTPTWTKSFDLMSDFKFYIGGGITGLQVTNILAVDSNGIEVAGISANLERH